MSAHAFMSTTSIRNRLLKYRIFDGVPNVITTSGPSERVDTTSMIPGHNSSMPLDVNSDGQVTALDVLAIYNAINDGLASATSALIDTSGDGLIHALDALLVINYLNRDIQTAASVVANASEETLDEVRATVLKDFLARTYPDGAQPADQILVGFELMPQPRPDAIGAVYFTEEELLTLQIRNMKQPGPDWLASRALHNITSAHPVWVWSQAT